MSSSSSTPLGLPLHAVSHESISDDEQQLDSVYGELTPSGVIPASGRGNSADGKYWENPSANALYRALKRKNKGINPEDAMAVAAIHTAVTENSWNGIQQIESFVAPECNDLSLVRFQGMDGIYTMKSRFFHRILGTPRPFDRHDWYVSRCGKEIRYILDYYSMENDLGEIEYTIDVRREPSVAGLWERAKYAHHQYKQGEKWF
jgi:cytochrome c heme-lyase